MSHVMVYDTKTTREITCRCQYYGIYCKYQYNMNQLHCIYIVSCEQVFVIKLNRGEHTLQYIECTVLLAKVN